MFMDRDLVRGLGLARNPAPWCGTGFSRLNVEAGFHAGSIPAAAQQGEQTKAAEQRGGRLGDDSELGTRDGQFLKVR